MSRKKIAIKKNLIGPDLKYDNILIHKLINNIMIDGKKSKAMNIVYNGLDLAYQNIHKNIGNKEEIINFFHQCLDNIAVGYKILRKPSGRNTISVPHPVSDEKKYPLTIKSITKVLRNKTMNKIMNDSHKLYKFKQDRSIALAKILEDSYNKHGLAHDLKIENEKIADANKDFLSNRW